MTGYLFFRKLYYIKQIIAQHYKAHKTLYIIGFLCFLLGFTTGIFSAIKYAEVVEFSNISDTILVNYLANNGSIIGLFFARLMGYLFLLLLLFFLGGFMLLAPFGFLFLIYKSFLFAVTITFFIILCGVGGVLLTIFVLLPVTLLVMLGLIILVVTCVSKSFLCKKYKLAYISNDAPHFLISTFYIVGLLLFFACLLELIFLPIISTTIIIII